MHQKIYLKYFFPSLVFLFLIYMYFFYSSFSGNALLIGTVSSVFTIVLSLFFNDRPVTELSRSFLFLSHKFVYSLAFLTLVYTLFALAAERIFFLLEFLGIDQSPTSMTIILSTICVGGYTCLTFLAWYISTQQPSGVPYITFLKENLVKVSAVFVLILGISLAIFLFLSPLFSNILPGLAVRRTIFALILLIVLIHIDFSKEIYKPSKKLSFEQNKNKLFLIGVDAADWRVIRPLLEQDKLPNLNKILAEASYGYLDSFGKRLSPVLWTSFITGATSEVHGITGFVFHEKGQKDPILFKSYHRKVPALWHILSAAGKKVGILNWLLSYPAETVNGYMISRLSPHAYEGMAYPKNIGQEIEPFMKTEGSVENASQEERQLQEINQELEVLEKITSHLLDNYEHDSFIFYTQTTDKIMHKFWHFKEPHKFKHKRWDLGILKGEKYGTAIENHWMKIDRLIGTILQKKDENTNIVIISDHGAKARSQPFLYVDGNKLLETLGFLKFQDDSDEIDFSQTQLYLNDPTIWNTYYAFSLNVKGREESGIIPEEAFDVERQGIIRFLQNLRTTKGKKLFSSVYAVDENGTDILAEHSSLLRKMTDEVLVFDEKQISLKQLLKQVEGVSGNHDPRGVVILSGPAFGKKLISGSIIEYAANFVLAYMQGLSQNKSILSFFEVMKRIKFIDPYTTLDVMPTLLHIMRLPAADYMQGRVMTRLLDSGSTKKLNFYKVKKYDIPIEEKKTDTSHDEEDKKIKDQLKGLGYLG